MIQLVMQHMAVLSHPQKGAFFGTTILGHDWLAAWSTLISITTTSRSGGPPTVPWAALETQRMHQAWEIFGNETDTHQDIVDAIELLLESVQVWSVDHCVPWIARRPR